MTRADLPPAPGGRDWNAGREPSPTLTLGFVGDVCLGMGIRDLVVRYGPDYPFAAVAGLLARHDITVGNLECCIVDNIGRASGFPPRLAIETNLATGLKRSGLGVLGLANNHILDCGAAGVETTLTFLEQEGIACFGAGRDIVEAEALRIVAHGGRRVGFLGACDVARCFAQSGRAGVAPFELDRLARRIRAARDRVDLLVVCVHADVEFATIPSPRRVRGSRWLVDQGADLVIQHHPHVWQGIERYHGGIIAYSLGNFVMAVHGNPYQERHPGTTDTFILSITVTFGAERLETSWECVPVTVAEDNRPAPSDTARARDQLRHLEAISMDLRNEAAVRRAWRVRCWREAKSWAMGLYYDLRRGRWAQGLRAAFGPLGDPDRRRWLLGLLSWGRI